MEGLDGRASGVSARWSHTRGKGSWHGRTGHAHGAAGDRPGARSQVFLKAINMVIYIIQ